MLRSDEQKWIANREKIWNILVQLRNDQISLINTEKKIRKVLYG